LNARRLDWLIAQPIAHRGLHDIARGLVENSIAAARAAVDAGYAIECDVQTTKDGDLVVFHDDTLERLTARGGRVGAFDAGTLSTIMLEGGGETIPTFSAFLAAVAGRVPLVVEVKSDFDGDLTGVKRAAELLSTYKGRVVIESFDPEPIAFLRANAPALGVAHIPLGIVGEARYDDESWAFLSPTRREELTHFLHYPRTRPDFLSWNAGDLPHAIPFLAREGLRVPVTSWTVRSPGQAALVRRWADQIVFEGFAPPM
jgi:glycerophosphoryl diester phosphodiesterase